jgi:hydrogenase maturation protease
MNQQKKNNVLIIGIGNTLRGDDGIGAYICARIEALHVNGVKTIVKQQLHTEMVEDFLTFDHIIIADASINSEAIQFGPVNTINTAPVASSHHVNASLLAALSKQLYNKELSLMICSVRGENFNIQEHLSAMAIANADLAVNTILQWLEDLRA